MRRLPASVALLFLTALPSVAWADAPTWLPVTGFLTDGNGDPIDGTVDLDFDLYESPTGTVSRYHELRNDIVVENGRFTVYLGEETALDLGVFRDYGMLYLAMSVNGAADLSPRFTIGSAPYAGYAQYCEEAESVGGVNADDLLSIDDDIEWVQLVGVPAELTDGDADTKYTAGTGLTLTNTQFSLSQSAVEGFARGVAYDSQAELLTALGDVFVAAPNVSCVADQILVSDGAGGWDCGSVDDFPLDEAAIDALVANNGYAASSALTALATRVTAAEGKISTLQTDVAALSTAVAGLQRNPGNLLVQYELDEASSSLTFADSSGLGNDLSAASGSVVAGSATSHSGKAVAFSGAGGLMAATNNKIPSTAQVQAEMWLRTGDVAQTATLIEKQGAWKLRLTGSRGEWTVTTVNGTCTITHPTLLVNNQWTHVSAWADGLTASVAVNGVVQTVGCTTGPIASAAGTPLTLGGRYVSSWSEVFNGNIDEVRVRPTAPETGFRQSGQVVNVTTYVSGVRRSFSGGAASIQMESFTVDKKSPTSYLLVDGEISGFGNFSGSMSQGWKFGTAAEVNGQGLMYSADTHGRTFGTKAYIAGYTTTGPQQMVFRYYTINNQAGNAPFTVYNPNVSDDNRLGQTQSVYTVWEIEP